MKGNFNRIINGDKPVLVDFSAEWCGPCKMQAPILKELSAEVKDKIRIIKIDIDKNAEIASRFQVRSVPTLAFFKDGKMVWRESGVRTKTQLLQLIGD
jgi:thioredoxin 1